MPVRNVYSHSSSSKSSSGVSRGVPAGRCSVPKPWALFTRMSTVPNAATVLATAAKTSSRRPTSQAMPSALPPSARIADTVSSIEDCVREATTTFAPSRA